MRTIDAVKLVVAAVVALVLVLVALVARTVLLFRLLFALTLGVLGVLIVTGSRGLLPKKVAQVCHGFMLGWALFMAAKMFGVLRSSYYESKARRQERRAHRAERHG